MTGYHERGVAVVDNGWMDGCFFFGGGSWMDVYMDGLMNELMDIWMDEQLIGWMNELMDIWMDEQIIGWLDGWMDRSDVINICVRYLSQRYDRWTIEDPL